MATLDGQTFSAQSPLVQSMFTTAYGANAAAEWEKQHNAAIGGGQLQQALGNLENAINSGNQDQYDVDLAKLMGVFRGQPTLTAQEDVGMVNGQPTTDEQRLSGLVLGGNPGLTAQEDAGVFGPNMGYLANRPTLAAQKQAGDLASSLLGDATKLQGPENYATYDRFIGGGRSLLDQLYGGPRASTGTTGDNQPNTLQTLMARLGLTGPLTSPRADMGPGVDATGTHPVPVTNMANLLFPNLGVDPNQTNAVQGVGGGGNNPDDNIGGMGSGVLSDVDPTQFIDPLTGGLKAVNGDVQSSLSGLSSAFGQPDNTAVYGYLNRYGRAPKSASELSSLYTGDSGQLYAPNGDAQSSLTGLSRTLGQPDTNSVYNFILKYGRAPVMPTELTTGPLLHPSQISPVNWDALSKAEQQQALSVAQAQGWDANDFLAQIDAQRPLGSPMAPNSVNTMYAPLAA